MFKMSPAVAALIVAGLVSLACSDQSGLRSGGSTAGAGGVATGGRTGVGLAGGAGGTLGPGGAGGASTGGAGSGTAGASGGSQDVCSGMPPTCFALCEGGVGCQCFCPGSGGAGGRGGAVTSGGAAATGGASSAGGAMGGNAVGSGGNASTAGSIRTGGVTAAGGATGGTIRTGGAISTGGSTGTGDASACLDSTVTFQVNRAPGNATVWCLGQPGSCSSDWLTISSQSGDLTLSGMCRTPCDTCQFMACPIWRGEGICRDCGQSRCASCLPGANIRYQSHWRIRTLAHNIVGICSGSHEKKVNLVRSLASQNVRQNATLA